MDKISTFISTYFDWFYITVPGTVDTNQMGFDL